MKDKQAKRNDIAIHFLMAVGLMAILSSCATIISGTTAKVTIDGRVDEPVTIVTSKTVYTDVNLPREVEVKRRRLHEQHITITSPSYAFSDIVIQRSLSPMAVVCALVNPFSLPVDMFTNAVSEPMQRHFYIEPVARREQADSVWRADSLRHVARVEALRKMKDLPARYRRHELSVGVGCGGNQADHHTHSMVRDYGRRYGLEPSFECGDIFGDSYLFADMEYHYRLNRKWEVGAFTAWGISGESYEKYPEYPSEPGAPELSLYQYGDGHEHSRYFALAPSVRYTWFENRQTRFYSRVALGYLRHHLIFGYGEVAFSDPEATQRVYSFHKNTDTIKRSMAWQLTVFGCRVGSGSIGMQCEVGYGCLGLVRLGLNVCF